MFFILGSTIISFCPKVSVENPAFKSMGPQTTLIPRGFSVLAIQKKGGEPRHTVARREASKEKGE